MSTITRNRFDKWQQTEIDYIVANWENMSREEVAEGLKAISNTITRTPSAVNTKAKELKLKKSKETIRRLARQKNSGQFIAGFRPANEIAVGTISVRTPTHGAPSKWIKLGEKHWQQLQHYTWEQAGFSIPDKHVLRFKDADPLNCDITNLETVVRGPHSRNPGTTSKMLQRRAQSIVEKAEARKAELDRKRAEKAEKKQAAINLIEAMKLERKLKKQLSIKRPAKRLAAKPMEVTKPVKADIAKPAKMPIAKTFLTEEDKERLKAEKAVIRKMNNEKRLFDLENKSSEDRAKDIFKARKKKKERDNEKAHKLANEPVLQLSLPDVSKKIPVKIGNMTVFVSPGADIEAIRLKYENRHKNFNNKNIGRNEQLREPS